MNQSEVLRLIEAEELKRAAERSLYEFVRQAWKVIEPGVPFVDGFHIRVICEHLEAITRGELRLLLINIPPRHAKSTIVTVLWPCWEWILSPTEKYLCASYSGILSTRDNVKARRLLQSPWYQGNWGDKFKLTDDQNQKTRFENDKSGYRIASSVGGTATGEGGTRLLLDDPHSVDEAQSDTMRAAAVEWFNTTWSSRFNDPKRDAAVTIMQRLHEMDVSGAILTLGGWEHLCLPAEFDGIRRRTILKPDGYDIRKDVGELLWPERFGRAEIDTLKSRLGQYGIAGQLQQDPSPPGGGILDTTCFRIWPADKPFPQFEYVLQSYDCAFTEKTTGDPTACSVYAIFSYEKKHQVMLIDAWDDYLSYPELRKRTIEDATASYGKTVNGGPMIRPHKVDRILVEKKASGQSLLQDLRLANVPAVGYNPGNADKISRAHQAAPTLELGIIWVPESTKPDYKGKPIAWANAFIQQLSKFPVGAHDDYVDTFTQAVIYLKNERWFDLPYVEYPDDVPVKKRDKVNPYAV